MLEARPEEKTCSRCGQRFSCGARCAGCWCQDLPAVPPADLAADVDCRCPQCLAEISGAAISAAR